MNSVVEGFFLHRAHIVLHERLDIKADHIAWMFREQCVEIILWLRLIQNLDDIPLTGEEDYTRPLYEMLETQYNIVVKTSKEEISARLAGEFIAEKLEIKSNDPILIRKRFVYDVNGVPIEYNVGYYRADSFTYTIEAER